MDNMFLTTSSIFYDFYVACKIIKQQFKTYFQRKVIEY